MTRKNTQALVLLASALWLVDLFLFGVLVGSHLHPTSLTKDCAAATPQTIPALFFSPFRPLPEGGTCV